MILPQSSIIKWKMDNEIETVVLQGLGKYSLGDERTSSLEPPELGPYEYYVRKMGSKFGMQGLPKKSPSILEEARLKDLIPSSEWHPPPSPPSNEEFQFTLLYLGNGALDL